MTEGVSAMAGRGRRLRRCAVQLRASGSFGSVSWGWGEGKGEMNGKARFYIHTLLCAESTAGGNRSITQGAGFSAL